MLRARATTDSNVFADIDAGRIATAWLLIGENTLLVDEILARLRAACIDPAFEAFDYESWLADDTSPEAFEQHIRQVPMGSTRRLVVVKGITRHGSKGPAYSRELGASGVERLLATLAAAPETSCGVFTGIAKRELTTLVKKHKLTGAVVPVDQPNAGDLGTFARHWAKEQALDLTADAARLLVEIAGADAAIVRSEVAKLAAACPPGARVTPAEIRELAGASREFTLAEYVERVLHRDVPGALEVLRRLEAWGNERDIIPGVIVWLTNGFIDLAAARGEALAPNLFWKVRYTIDRWRDLGEIHRILQALYRLNRDLVTGKPEMFARLETLTACTACRVTPDYCDRYTGASTLCLAPRARRKAHA